MLMIAATIVESVSDPSRPSTKLRSIFKVSIGSA